MKRAGLIHPRLLAAIGRLGHTDEVIVCDAGFPIPRGIPRIDLGYRAGMPPFLDVLETLLAEIVVEGAVVASEAAPDLAGRIGAAVGVEPERVPHAAFKERGRGARLVIRTGEFTPYANVILVCGVPF
jgi:D-ribose pyranase